jgi:DNA invertase Pin-like site-specific DNA recombinase
MNRNEQPKIQARHVERRACIYVRQSSLTQVQENQESTLRQYGLRTRAQELGWSVERIEIIDDDLGQSASDLGRRRNGFQRLLAEVVNGEVGAVFSVEVSRLARQDSEGHRLVEVAALTDTLLIDEQQVYDARLGDDRLMLGLKVLLSSNELRVMNQRLKENKIHKAQRGQLRMNLPVGLIFDPHQGICLDPDERVQGAVKLLFEQFRISRRLSSVVHYFNDNGLLFPKREKGWESQLVWGPLSLQRVHMLLRNPFYAGAYVYGRTAERIVIGDKGEFSRQVRRLDPEDWIVARWDAFDGYISREEYEANQARLEQNRQVFPNKGRRRDGAALLSGLVLCGRCGRRMYVSYNGHNGCYPIYICSTYQRRYALTSCQQVPARAIDSWVVEQVLAALSPAQIELSLAVVKELERQQEGLYRQWQSHLESARYAAQLAQRRYEKVDPDNRLVARALEAQWEARLQEVKQQESDFERLCCRKSLSLNADQRKQLQRLAEDLPVVWNAETTSWSARKELLELLVADVTISRHETGITVHLRWHTNTVDTIQLPLPAGTGRPTSVAVIDRIRDLYQNHTDQQVAEILNQEGLRTTMGNLFSDRKILHLRTSHGLRKLLLKDCH